MDTIIILGGFIIILIGIIVFLMIYFIRNNNRIKKDYNDYQQLKYNEIYEREKSSLEAALQSTREQVRLAREELNDVSTYNANVKKLQDDELNERFRIKESAAMQQLNNDIKEWAKSAQEAENLRYLQCKGHYDELITSLDNTYNETYQKVQEIQQQRDALNQEILRSRIMEEHQDFYKIDLDDSSINDIKLINSIRDKIIKVELLNKLIYTNYIDKPAKEMIKRVLNGASPCGIYKVTNILTKEIYIGKSTNIAARWANHLKAAYGLEGVADSMFQRALKKYGIQNFTWEVLEEVPKDKLGEREKYYISFYDTKTYGYNERLG